MTVNRGDTSMTRTSRNGKRIGRPPKVQAIQQVELPPHPTIGEALFGSKYRATTSTPVQEHEDYKLGDNAHPKPDDTQLKAFLKAVYRDGLDGRHRDLKTDVEALRRLV
jgi:hypothetical protein